MQPEDIVEAELVTDENETQTTAAPNSSVRLIEQILSPQSLQWMMLSGGGMLVIGFVVWLWSVGVFENPLMICGLVGAVTTCLLGSGVAMVRFSRYQLAGRGITLLGSIALPLNLWLYDAQGLVTLADGGHLWIPAALFCLIYAAVARVLKDSAFVYALVGGVVLTGMLFLADASIGRFWALLPPVTFLVVIGWLSAFAERLFVDDEGDFSRKNFGQAFHRAGLLVVACGLTLLLGGHIAAAETHLFFDKLWPVIASSQPHKLWALVLIAGSGGGFAIQSMMHKCRLYRVATALLCCWLVPVTLNFFAIETTLSHASIVAAMAIFFGNLFVARRGRQKGEDRKLNQGAHVGSLIVTYSPAAIGCLVAVACGQLIFQMFDWENAILFSSLGWTSTLQILTAGLAALAYAWGRPETAEDSPLIRTSQILSVGAGAALVMAAGWSSIFVQTFIPLNQAAIALLAIPAAFAIAGAAFKNRQATSVLQSSAIVAMTVHLVFRVTVEQSNVSSIFSFDPSLQWSAILAVAAAVYWTASRGAANNTARMLSYTAAALAGTGLADYFGFNLGYCLVLAPMLIGLAIRVAESIKHSVQKSGAPVIPSAIKAANVLVLSSGIGGVLLALSRWIVGDTGGILLLVTMTLLACTTTVCLLTKNQAWRATFRALIVALVGASLCVFDGWLAIDGWHRAELCSILGGVSLLGLGHLAWSREGETQDDAASISLLLGSMLVAVPLTIGLLVYRFGMASDPTWMLFHNVTAIAAGMALLGSGVCCKLRSTTISGAGLLGIYLLSLVALIDLPDQLQSISVMMMIGGGLFFSTALLMSIYRDRLVSLPRRIREGEGVYRILKWR